MSKIKVFYEVAFDQKEMAKEMNLKWDNNNKCWYGVNIDIMKFNMLAIHGMDIDKAKEIIETHNNKRKLCYCIECRQFKERKKVHKMDTITTKYDNGYVDEHKYYQCKKCIKKETDRKAKHDHLYKTDKAYRDDCDSRSYSVNILGHE